MNNEERIAQFEDWYVANFEAKLDAVMKELLEYISKGNEEIKSDIQKELIEGATSIKHQLSGMDERISAQLFALGQKYHNRLVDTENQ